MVFLAGYCKAKAKKNYMITIFLFRYCQTFSGKSQIVIILCVCRGVSSITTQLYR